jgi:hypothetical protein
MEMKPSDVIKVLSTQDRVLLNKILNEERDVLHHEVISNRVEKDIVNKIIKLIDRDISDDN